MVNERSAEARKRMRDQFGTELASKATEAFLLTFDVGQEGVGEPQAVIEFSPPTERLREGQAAIQEVRTTAIWDDVKTALRATSAPEQGLMLRSELLLRQAMITPLRNDFHQAAGVIADELERATSERLSPGPEATGPGLAPAPTTQICWLNRTVRTVADPGTLAEVAADPKIERVDAPRMLEPDVMITSVTVGATPFRERTGRTGRGTIIAVIDGEVALRHPYLQDRVVHKQNYTSQSWGNPQSHGTAVAGIVAANGKDLVGIAPEAVIYSYKVFPLGTDFDGALALQQALEDGVDIANCSWGSGSAGRGESREARACDTAWQLGLTIVKSAGNRGPRAGSLTAPSDAEGVIVVGATDRMGKTVQDYSSRGPTPGGVERPHLVAPGGTEDDGIISCLVSGEVGPVGAGTSFAAPHVSGMLALILEGDPDLTADEQRERLLKLCEPLRGVDVTLQGRGLVSMARML
jgi:serine protease AprX